MNTALLQAIAMIIFFSEGASIAYFLTQVCAAGMAFLEYIGTPKTLPPEPTEEKAEALPEGAAE